MTITTQTPDGVMHEFPDGTDQGVIDSAMKSYVTSNQQPQASAGDSWSDDLKQAGGSLMTEAGSLAQGAGSATGIKALGDAGSWLKSNAPQPSAGYQNRGGQFVSDLGKGEYSQAAGDLAHGAVAGLGNTAGVLGGFVLGGPWGAAAAAGAESLGAHANEEAKGGPVTGTHLLHAAPEAAADAAITGATAGFMPEGAGLVNAAKRSALMGVSGAGQSAADQAIEKGSVDPSQVLNAGASGAASAGLAEAPGVISRGAGQATMNVASRAYKPANDLEAMTVDRVGSDIAARKADAIKAGQDATDFQVANNLKSEYATDLNNVLKGLRARGADKEDIDTLSALINQQALRHNNTLDLATDGLFNRIDSMDLPDMGPVTKEDIKNKLLDLNTISNQSFLKNGTGPWQMALGKIGQYAGVAGSLITGNPLDALASIGGKNSMGGKVGSLVGAGLDRAFGSNVPPVTLQRLAAQRYLASKGLTSDPTGRLALPDYTPPGPSTPTPGFIRPNASNTIGYKPPESPAPTPGFIRPTFQAPQAPAPTPGFIRPGPTNTINPAPAPQAPAPTPGFIRPNASNTIQTAPAPAPEGPSTPAPNPLSMLRAVKAQAAARAAAAAENAPDPVTGNRPDPVPVNTRIRNGGPPVQPPIAPPLPSNLRVNTPGDVAQAVSRDDGVPLATTAQTLSAASTAAARPASTWLPGSAYIRNGVAGVQAHGDAVQWARQAEAAGAVPKGTGDLIESSIAPLDKRVLNSIVNYANGQMMTPGVDPVTGGVKGVSGIKNLPAYMHNLQQEGDAYAAVPDHLKTFADTVRNPVMNGKTKAGRRQLLDMVKAGRPDIANELEQHIGPLTGYGQG